VTEKLIQQFRNAVYQSLVKRPDAVFDWIDTLTVAGHVESTVALSEKAPFRRKFSMVYDILSHVTIDFDALNHFILFHTTLFPPCTSLNSFFFSNPINPYV
jgi:hypothetical protein